MMNTAMSTTGEITSSDSRLFLIFHTNGGMNTRVTRFRINTVNGKRKMIGFPWPILILTDTPLIVELHHFQVNDIFLTSLQPLK